MLESIEIIAVRIKELEEQIVASFEKLIGESVAVEG